MFFFFLQNTYGEFVSGSSQGRPNRSLITVEGDEIAYTQRVTGMKALSIAGRSVSGFAPSSFKQAF